MRFKYSPRIFQLIYVTRIQANETSTHNLRHISHLCRPVRSTFAVRETASLGIMGEPRVPPLNPSESIVF